MKKYVIGSGALLAGIVLTAGSLAWAQTSSTQVTACARPNGDIYLIGPSFTRQSCSGQQVEISWPTLAGTLTKLSLVDANGNYLGRVVEGSVLIGANAVNYVAYNEAYEVFLQYAQEPTNFSPSPYSFELNPNSYDFFFEDVGCSGRIFNPTFVAPNTVYTFLNLGIVGYFKGATTPESFTQRSASISGACQNITPTTTVGFEFIPLLLPDHLASPASPIRVVETQF